MRFTLFEWFGDSATKIQNADADKIAKALAYDDGNFFRWQQQILNVQCAGVWPQDDARKVDELLAISKTLQDFFNDKENEQRQNLTSDQLGRLEKLFMATQQALGAAKKVCESDQSYTNPDLAKKGVTRDHIKTVMGYETVRTNQRTGAPITEESGVGVTGKIAKALGTNDQCLKDVRKDYEEKENSETASVRSSVSMRSFND